MLFKIIIIFLKLYLITNKKLILKWIFIEFY
jgi:hypothetical protein